MFGKKKYLHCSSFNDKGVFLVTLDVGWTETYNVGLSNSRTVQVPLNQISKRFLMTKYVVPGYVPELFIGYLSWLSESLWFHI